VRSSRLRSTSASPTTRSHALLDQLRSVDKRLVRRVFGRITENEMRAIDEGLTLFLGLRGEVETG
jgi:mRNA-degrading endonuclease toxin of MazEF toxin-antitoxin module